jgi:hypothetical protein
MLLADVTISTEAGLAISGLLITLTGAIGVIYKQLIKNQEQQISNYDKQLLEMKSQRDSYRQIGDEAVRVLEQKINKDREVAGKQPFPVIASVVAEHNSPVTEAQQDAADLATLRAKMVAAKLIVAGQLSEEERVKRLEAEREAMRNADKS